MECSWHRDRFSSPLLVWQDQSKLAHYCCCSYQFCCPSMSNLRFESNLKLTCCLTSCTNLAFMRWSGELEGISSGYYNGGSCLDRDHCWIECEGFPVCVLILVICWLQSVNFCHNSSCLHLDRSCQLEKRHWHYCCCFACVDCFDSLSSSGTWIPVNLAFGFAQIMQQNYYRSRLKAILEQICGLRFPLTYFGKD